MPTIHSIPIEIFLDSLLPILDVPSLLALGCTDKFFAALCSDDTVWKRRLRDDRNIRINDARNRGFKSIYLGVRRPSLFVWGDAGNGRLGMGEGRRGGVLHPTRLDLPETRIVSIVAGGWSFAALDEDGRLHVWGQLDAEDDIWIDQDFGESGHTQYTPLRLDLSVPLVSVSAGRQFLVALDSRSRVWLFASWGRPALVHADHPALAYPSSSGSLGSAPASARSRVIQVEAGWSLFALLTSSGSVLIEFPFDGGPLGAAIDRHLVAMVRNAAQRSGWKRGNNPDSVKAEEWDVSSEPFELPPLPEDLPQLDSDDGVDAETSATPPKIVKIAAGDNFVVVLTDKGHVLKIDVSPHRHLRVAEVWQYLGNFCETSAVQTAFRAKGLDPPSSVKITHITAQFKTFAVYSVGANPIVLLGRDYNSATSSPTILPGLQNRKVISVVLGDYHFGALTEDGKMLTWGKFSNGALGHGPPSRRGGTNTFGDRTEPKQVRFDGGRFSGDDDHFVFGIAACGWHTAALVVNSHPSERSSKPARGPSKITRALRQSWD